MGADMLLNFGSIQDELEKAKSNLKGLNENIRRIVGREPPDAQLRGDRKRGFGAGPVGGNNNSQQGFGGGGGGGGVEEKRHGGELNNVAAHKRGRRDSPPPKRRHVLNADGKSVFSRLSGPPGSRGGGGGGKTNSNHHHHHHQQHHQHHNNNNNNHTGYGNGGTAAPPTTTTTTSSGDEQSQPHQPQHKPKLNSRVIREMPTRQEIVEAQGTDAASRARNRRMFGSLLGTLQKFCQEESRLKPKEDRKAQIEKKLEEQQLQERETMKRERQDLFLNRKRQQIEIKMLETKMNRMKELAAWEEMKKPLSHFIRTKAKPRIYFLPKVMDRKAEKKLEESRVDLEKMIEKKRTEVAEELSLIESRFKMNDASAKSGLDPNGGTHSQLAGEESVAQATKHDRRSPHEDDEEDDEDSPYINRQSDGEAESSLIERTAPADAQKSADEKGEKTTVSEEADVVDGQGRSSPLSKSLVQATSSADADMSITIAADKESSTKSKVSRETPTSE